MSCGRCTLCVVSAESEALAVLIGERVETAGHCSRLCSRLLTPARPARLCSSCREHEHASIAMFDYLYADHNLAGRFRGAGLNVDTPAENDLVGSTGFFFFFFFFFWMPLR